MTEQVEMQEQVERVGRLDQQRLAQITGEKVIEGRVVRDDTTARSTTSTHQMTSSRGLTYPAGMTSGSTGSVDLTLNLGAEVSQVANRWARAVRAAEQDLARLSAHAQWLSQEIRSVELSLREARTQAHAVVASPDREQTTSEPDSASRTEDLRSRDAQGVHG